MRQGPSRAERMRKLQADLKIKNGDLRVLAGRLRRAQDFEQHLKAGALQKQFDKVKETISDVKQTIAELEVEEAQDGLPVAS